MILTPTEERLRDYHRRHPGRQSAEAKDLRAADGRTTYEAVAAHADGARRVLDLGCADGWLLSITPADFRAGIDLSEAELAFARARPELADADLREGRAQELPWADDSFDAVLTHMALMLMDDVETVASEVARVLVPGGVFVAGIGGGPQPGEGLELFLGVAAKHKPKHSDSDAPKPRTGDKRTRTRDGLDEIFGPAGFAPFSWEPMAIDLGGTPEKFFEHGAETYYDIADASPDVLEAFRADFLAAAPALVRTGGHLPARMIINIATSRLAV